MDSKQWWPTAETSEHVKAFCELLADKGYRAITVNGERNNSPGPELNLNAFEQMSNEFSKHVNDCLERKEPIRPFHIGSLVTEPANTKFPSLFTHCDLEIVYDRNLGFKATGVCLAQSTNIEDPTNIHVEVSTRIPSNEFIPTAQQAASLQPPIARPVDFSKVEATAADCMPATLQQHIDELSKLLAGKGYQEFDVGPLGVSAHEALLHQYTRAAAKFSEPFTLSTTVFGPKKVDSIRHETMQCDFTTQYIPEYGFVIRKLSLAPGIADRGLDVRKPRTVFFSNNEQIPRSTDVFARRQQRKKGRKH
jgi:hypothetical protein